MPSKEGEIFPPELQEVVGLREVITPESLVELMKIGDLGLEERVGKVGLQDFKEMSRRYVRQVRELWELTPSGQRGEWEEFRAGRLADLGGVWVYDKGTKKLVSRVLPEEDFRWVYYSRLYPLFIPDEVEKLRKSRVLFFGLSTNSPVVRALVDLGLGDVVGADGDDIELSNVARMEATTERDVGVNKAVFLAGHLVKKIPYLKFGLYPREMTPIERREAIERSNAVVEMTDNLGFKIEVRGEAKERLKTVFMGTGTDTQPVFQREGYGDKPFLRDDLTATGLGKIVEIVGRDNLSNRQMAHLILMAKGEISYLAQHGATAAGVAFVLSTMIASEMQGYRVKSEVALNVPLLIYEVDQMKKRDDAAFVHLCSKYPNIFLASDGSLERAIKRLEPEALK